MPRGDTRPQSRQGILDLAREVTVTWKWGWQEHAPENDEAFDGLIYPRRKGRDLGATIFVQVKCGYRTSTRGDVTRLSLPSGYVLEHRLRWVWCDGPAILVWVERQDDASKRGEAPRMLWADLRDPATYDGNAPNVIVLKNTNRFNEKSQGPLLRMCGFRRLDRNLPILSAEKRDFAYYAKYGEPLKALARHYWKNWLPELVHPSLGRITASRTGWSHIVGPRRPERCMQSLQLLGVARRMLLGESAVQILRRLETVRSGNRTRTGEYIGLTARVRFPHRHEGVIKVILLRIRDVYEESDRPPSTTTWLYSIYEPRRGQTAI